MEQLPQQQQQQLQPQTQQQQHAVVNDNLEVTGVSRSGRVRKKSSKLMDFQSPDDIDTKEKKKDKKKRLRLGMMPMATSTLSQPPQKRQSSTTTTKMYLNKKPRIDRGDVKIGGVGGGAAAAGNGDSIEDDSSEYDDLQIMDSSDDYPTNEDDDDDDEDDDDDDIDDDNGFDKTSLTYNRAIENPSINFTAASTAAGGIITPNDDNDNSDHDPSELFIDETVRKSAYMQEKSNKKQIYKDGKYCGVGRPQRKDKGKSRFTAYMIWAKEMRQEMLHKNPSLDFASASRRLGEMWTNVSSTEKLIWRRRAKRYAAKNKGAASNNKESHKNNSNNNNNNMNLNNMKMIGKKSNTFLNRNNNIPVKAPPRVGRPPKKHLQQQQMTSSTLSTATSRQPPTKLSTKLKALLKPKKSPKLNKIPKATKIGRRTITGGNQNAQQNQPRQSTANNNQQNKSMNHSNNNTTLISALNNSVLQQHKYIGTTPLDIAAYLKLLSDSLTIIGSRLKEHEGQITVSGSLSVLLDSLLCALAPLMCLPLHVPDLGDKLDRNILCNTLDNIAYVMPGL